MSGTIDDPKDLAAQLLKLKRQVEALAKGGARPRCRVQSGAPGQSIYVPLPAGGVDQPYPFGSTVWRDDAEIFDPATPDRLHLRRPGLWVVRVHGFFGNTPVGDHHKQYFGLRCSGHEDATLELFGAAGEFTTVHTLTVFPVAPAVAIFQARNGHPTVANSVNGWASATYIGGTL